MHPRDKFPRTVCACKDCCIPCKHLPGMLAPGDLSRIAEHVGKPLAEIITSFRASPGAIVAKLDHSTGRLVKFNIPTIVPAADEKGCVFLSDGRCTIHPVAPFGCSHFDWHMDRSEANPRSESCLRAILRDSAYRDHWVFLYAMELTTEGPEEKRQRMREATGNM